MMDEHYPILTVGTVVDTNDPQQQGRLRVSCPKWGDTNDTKIVNIPWASYVSPFGGILTRGTRGPEEATTTGPVAYGMWAIPKVGSLVVCMLIDGDANHRVWVGSIHPDHMAHTLPMGRFLDGGVNGPLSSSESPIEPLSTNMKEAFQQQTSSPEWQTRAAENQAASIGNTVINKVVSSQADDRSTDSRKGYQKSRIRGDLVFDETDGNFDSQVYSITTPGMHTILMDDSLKNGKIRFRTTSGNQIIMDDTNERIYVSTPEGKNWVEMDRAGNVDVYSDRRMSFHALKGFNFTTEGEFRISAGSFHLRTQTETRIHADTNFELRAGSNVDVQMGSHLSIDVGSDIDIGTVGHFNITVGTAFNLATGTTLYMQSTSAFSVDAGTTLNLESSNDMDFLSGGNINEDATEIHLNDGLATNAKTLTAASLTTPNYAYTTSRVPIKEPWGRISNDPAKTDQDASSNIVSLVLNMTKTSATLELSYTSGNANKVDLGDNLGRNNNWHR